MSNLSGFESRNGKLSCTAADVFNFVTDLRNFEQLIHQGNISNWQAEKESCSFTVSMVGTVKLRLMEKAENNKVVFTGDALNKNDFSLVLNITENASGSAEANVALKADLNPMLKMIASKPIVQFLEKLIVEMENFRGWESIK